MPIRVTCPNCGKQFSAWEDLVGKTVQCPKCKQQTVLGGPNPQLDPPPATRREGPPSQRPAASGSPTAGVGTLPGVTPIGKLPVGKSPAGKPPSTASPARPNPAPTSSVPRPGSPAAPPMPATTRPVSASPQRTPYPPPPQLAGDDSIPLGCPHCNAPMEPNDDLCNKCGYHLILKKVIDISDMKQPSRATGFERMLEGQLHETESGHSVMLWVKIVAGFLLLVVFFLCLGQWWWIGVLVTAGVAALYWATYRRRAARATDDESTVNQDPLAGIVWSTLLGMERITGWRRLQWPFGPVKSMTLSDPSFHDDELPDLTGLSELEALDLEGTGVTDEGLRHLRDLKQLRFLVIRRTKVTPSGAQRLQCDLPNALIWY